METNAQTLEQTKEQVKQLEFKLDELQLVSDWSHIYKFT